MKNVLFVTYQSIDTDGRTKALLDILRGICNLTLISMPFNCTYPEIDCRFIECSGYLDFIKKVKKEATNIKNQDIVFIDNRRATIPGLYLKKKIGCKAVYDARELYLKEEMENFKEKLGCYFEDKVIKTSEFVVVANDFRKKIMDEIYKDKEIVVFDNFRMLSYSSDVDINAISEKYNWIFEESKHVVISTAGCDLTRNTDSLVASMKDFEGKMTLLLVGCKDDDDRKVIETILNDNKISNVIMLGRLNHDELKYLISKSKTGIAMYHKKNSNNLYCSSGKIYEFLLEGVPIATSDNPPLKSVIEEYQVGMCDENIAKAIENVYENYEFYTKNAEKLIDADIVNTKQHEFRNQLEELINHI